MKLLRTLILRPLARDWLRTCLTVIAVALGVAVVIGIELAGDAAVGSFQSSLTTILGKTDLQITANGGIDEKWMGPLTQLPYNARFSPVTETRVLLANGGSATLFGIDPIPSGERLPVESPGDPDHALAVSQAMADRLGLRTGGRLELNLPSGVVPFEISRIIPVKDSEFLALDIAAAQRALGTYGRIDRIEVAAGPGEDFDRLERAVRELLPPGYELEKPGTRSNENQRMLRAFRWNLRVLSYISLVVGAFLIYNTISNSVVRRRPEIGILRALGTSRAGIFWIFVTEALILGAAGSLLGVGLGRILAGGMVGLIGQTVNSLYVSSRPAAISLTLASACTAALSGLAVALLSAAGPAREAMQVTPVEAMGRGSRESGAVRKLGRNLLLAIVLAALALAASLPGPVDGKPIFGYASVLLAIGAAAFAAPALVTVMFRSLGGPLRRCFGAEGLLAARGLAASLGRTSVVVGALGTAIAMMASVAIMVGSFRETVLVWLDTQLVADIYIRPAGPASAGIYPPLPDEVAGRVARVPGVEAVDRFSALEFRFQGQRASIGGADAELMQRYSRVRFLEGGNRETVLGALRNHSDGEDRAIVTQAFASKHNLHAGQRITVALGDRRAPLTIAGVYFDYTSERGFVIVDRETLRKYLPQQPLTSLAVFLRNEAKPDVVRAAIQNAIARWPVDVAPNAYLRQQAILIFDRTFAITYALEGVAILVATLGAANSLLALVLDRRREIGLLRYLGGARLQIQRMVLVEAGLLGLMANVLGLVLGFALSLVLIYVINAQSFGWTIQFHPPVLLLGGALLTVWCVTIVAGVYPARVASRLNPIDVIHEE